MPDISNKNWHNTGTVPDGVKKFFRTLYPFTGQLDGNNLFRIHLRKNICAEKHSLKTGDPRNNSSEKLGL